MYTEASRKPAVERTTAASTSPTRKAREQFLQQESTSRPLGADPELQQKLEQAETTRREAKALAERAKNKSRIIEDRLQVAKIEVGKWLDAKDNLIQKLRRQLAQQQEATWQNAEQVEELEEYVKVQETCFTTQLAVKDKLLEEINDKFNQQQEDWDTKRKDLEKRCAEVENVAERRRLDLLIAQGQLLQTEATSNAQDQRSTKSIDSRAISCKYNAGKSESYSQMS